MSASVCISSYPLQLRHAVSKLKTHRPLGYRPLACSFWECLVVGHECLHLSPREKKGEVGGGEKKGDKKKTDWKVNRWSRCTGASSWRGHYRAPRRFRAPRRCPVTNPVEYFPAMGGFPINIYFTAQTRVWVWLQHIQQRQWLDFHHFEASCYMVAMAITLCPTRNVFKTFCQPSRIISIGQQSSHTHCCGMAFRYLELANGMDYIYLATDIVNVTNVCGHAPSTAIWRKATDCTGVSNHMVSWPKCNLVAIRPLSTTKKHMVHNVAWEGRFWCCCFDRFWNSEGRNFWVRASTFSMEDFQEYAAVGGVPLRKLLTRPTFLWTKYLDLVIGLKDFAFWVHLVCAVCQDGAPSDDVEQMLF